jgi:membrane protease subunit HflK
VSEDDGGTAARIERGAGRFVRRSLLFLLSLLLIGAWIGSSGWYRLQPGEAGVVLQLGRYARTETAAGVHLKLPLPFETVRSIRLGELRRAKFGFADSQRAQLTDETATPENAIQTADNNIVMMSYVVQYYVRDPFSYVYGMADPESLLRDAAQSAMREVVGRRPGREALTEDRSGIQREAEALLQKRLDGYFPSPERSAFRIDSLEILDSQAPVPVQDAFDDVVSASQDRERAQAEARGDAREIVERALAEGQEVREAAIAYRDAKLLEAAGEAARFTALLAEYERAPEVTRTRLYLEAMEEVMPGIEKVVIEQDTVNLLPFLPLGRQRPEATP